MGCFAVSSSPFRRWRRSSDDAHRSPNAHFQTTDAAYAGSSRMTTETNTAVTHIGGRRYGDGEIVVDFQNVGSTQAPLIAVAICPNGRAYEARFTVRNRPSVTLAARLIATVRAREAKTKERAAA
jgi:hypothetical protein